MNGPNNTIFGLFSFPLISQFQWYEYMSVYLCVCEYSTRVGTNFNLFLK